MFRYSLYIDGKLSVKTRLIGDALAVLVNNTRNNRHVIIKRNGRVVWNSKMDGHSYSHDFTYMASMIDRRAATHDAEHAAKYTTEAN